MGLRENHQGVSKARYTKNSNYFRLHACVIDNRGPCQDIVTGESIDDLQAIWLQAIDTAFERALAETMAGLQDWAALLTRLQANVEVNLGDAIVKQIQPAAYTRKKALAGYPYLFLQVPRIPVDQLIKDLRTHGAKFTKAQRQALEQHLSASLRSALDQALRALLRRSKASQQAGIFMLPDRSAVWFRHALARITADAVNEKQYVIDSDTQEETLERHVRYFGRPCEASKIEGRKDLCLAVKALYGGSETALSDKVLGEVRFSQQLATVNGALFDPRVPRSGDPQQPRFYPRRGPKIQQRAEASDQYVRVSGATDNDDRIYLRAAVLAAVQELGYAIAEHMVIPTFREELLP